MKMKLVDIPNVPEAWKTFHTIKALSVEERNEVLSTLASWRIAQEAEYKKILYSIHLACSNKRLRSPKHVVPDKKKRPVFELRANKGNARIMFFYEKDSDDIVCTNIYWKTSDDEKHQGRAFDRADNLRMDWENWKRGGDK